jgi:hypothetical protein
MELVTKLSYNVYQCWVLVDNIRFLTLIVK